MKERFFICNHCKNIIAMIRDTGVSVYCCGEKMQEIVPGITEGAKEKHIPVYDINDKTVSVRVGSTEHPMIEEHYIEWICVETENGFQYKKLEPNTAPHASFSLSDEDEVTAVYAFCNQHSLWKA